MSLVNCGMDKNNTGVRLIGPGEYEYYIEGDLVSEPDYYEYMNQCSNTETESQVDHPNHYNKGSIEVIEVIEDWDLNFARGSVIKYVGRAGLKDDELQDLEKALWYIQREISRLKE